MSTPTPQQYANLAHDVYNNRQITKDSESITIGGRRYYEAFYF